MASQVPTMYDGTTSQVVFAEYFRLQAVYQDWDNDKACLVLHLFLRGNAKIFLRHLIQLLQFNSLLLLFR